jgi:hypothetical protein
MVAFAAASCALAASPGTVAAKHHRRSPARHHRRSPPQQFQLGLDDISFLKPSSFAADLAALRALNGSWIRLVVRWALIAPAHEPSSFDPANPADHHYSWALIDAFMRAAASNHVHVILTPAQAPSWAEGPDNPHDPSVGPGAWDPSASDFGTFMQAFAERYSGQFPDPLNPGSTLPRVQYWEIWNEENLPGNLAAPDLVSEYRSLLNAGYFAVKTVNPTNVVIVGGLSPVSPNPPRSMSPLTFAAALMCVGGERGRYRAPLPCPVKAAFDAFGFHPYTLGATPTVPSPNPDDMYISDIGRLISLLALADRHHLTLPAKEHQRVWVTEWSLFTDPPLPAFGVADRIAARYVDYSMYLLWHFKIPVVVWFVIQDPPGASTLTLQFIPGGGLYWPSGRQKLMGRAFQFPMFASVGRRRAHYWGRVPLRGPVRVVVQRAVPGGWRVIARTRTRPDGVFSIWARPHGQALYRAYVPGGPVSIAYNSRPIPAEATHG